MPKMQLILTPEEAQNLAQDLSLIASAASRRDEGVSRTMVQQLWRYETFFEGEDEAEWPAPLDHTTAHQSSCDRCEKTDATVRVREIIRVTPSAAGPAVSYSFFGSRNEWRCDGCNDTPYILGYDRQGNPEVTDAT